MYIFWNKIYCPLFQFHFYRSFSRFYSATYSDLPTVYKNNKNLARIGLKQQELSFLIDCPWWPTFFWMKFEDHLNYWVHEGNRVSYKTFGSKLVSLLQYQQKIRTKFCDQILITDPAWKSSTIEEWYRRILWKNNSLIKRGLFFFVISKILNIYGKYGNKNITEFQEEEDSLTFFQLPDYLLLAVFAPLRW